MTHTDKTVRVGLAQMNTTVGDIEGNVALIVGFTDADEDGLYNAAAVCHRGKVAAVIHKQLLPNYGVFDEQRYFTPGKELLLFDTPEGVIGICVCEDVWFDPGPAIGLGDAGAGLIININASPFHKAKLEERTTMLRQRARRAEASLVYLNAVGGQDELVFDGGSMVVQPDSVVLARGPQFEEHFSVVDVPLAPVTRAAGARTR